MFQMKSGWVPLDLSWERGFHYVNCLYTHGRNDQFVFLKPTHQSALTPRVQGVRSKQELNGKYVYWELVVGPKQLRDPRGYTQMGIATDQADISVSRLRHRGVFGYDEESYVLNLHGCALHVGISKKLGAVEEGKSEFRIGFLFDGIQGRLKFFQVGCPKQTWAFTDIPLEKKWFVAFGTISPLCTRDKPAVEICQSVRAPNSLMEATVGTLLAGSDLTSQAKLKQMLDKGEIPIAIYEFLEPWITFYNSQYKPTFSMDMMREPFANSNNHTITIDDYDDDEL